MDRIARGAKLLGVQRVKSLLKRVAFSALAHPLLLKRKIERSAQLHRLTILSFHRVAPLDGSAYPPLQPELFEEAIAFCKRAFELVQFRSLNEYRGSSKPLAIISFDDGYADFLDYSLPILRRHGVRCNHNLIPGCLLSGLPPINVMIQDFIGKAPDGELAAVDRLGWIGQSCASDRPAAGLQVSRWIKSKPIAEQRTLAAQLAESVDLGSYATPMMNSADARAIADEVELGAHSFEHASLSLEADDYIRDDARKCLDFFEQQLGTKTEIYALPNGDGAGRANSILKEAGFRHILLTEECYSTPDSNEHRRFTMVGTTRPEIRVRSAGLVRH